MYCSSSLPQPFIHERSFEYSPSPKEFIYEISLKTASYNDWLKELQGAHRLVQTLLQGQMMGQYQLFDFLIWSQGLFARVTLKEAPTLAEFLRFLKEKSSPPGESSKAFWGEEPQWIKLVTAEKLPESTRLFLEKVDRLRNEMNQSQGSSPNLFFYYRDSRLAG